MSDNNAYNPEICLPLGNGFCLSVEKSTDPDFPNEIYVGLFKDGCWYQDLVMVRQPYSWFDGKPRFDTGGCEVAVYTDKDNEDFTDEFYIGIHEEEE